MAASHCSHLDTLPTPPPEPSDAAGCHECLQQGGQWLHLRICQSCGHIGCCDNSPGRHATGHFQSTTHPVIRSFEPGEDWWWCYVDELPFEIPGAEPAPSHP
jgi:hypothetical protein